MDENNGDQKTSKRFLKVYYRHYEHSNKPHPVIRLAGIYLSQLDFKIGDKIEVSTEPGRIVITKANIAL